jgi:dTDP-glucose 4,6-dehydratase
MDAGKMSRELGWKPAENFESGLRKTVAWFLDNPDWVAHVTSGAYRNWIEKNYGKRGAA